MRLDAASPLKRQLHEDGYCCIPEFLTADEVEALRSETRQYPERLTTSAPSDEYSVDWDGPDRIRQIYHAEVLSPLLDAVIRSERSLALLRQVYGYDIGLYHAKFILKDAGGSAVPWHQDFTYWSSQSAHPCQINCMVYLDDADAENGCLQVVPGSHVSGLRVHASSADRTFSAGLSGVDPAAVRSVPGRAGTAILFGPLLVHSSGPNRASRPRHSFTAVYTNPFLDSHREVLSCFFPQDRIRALSGPGPFGFCSAHYQLRNLWHVAFDSFQGIPEPWATYPAGHWKARPFVPNRPDVTIVHGWFERSLTGPVVDRIGPIGLLHIDCDLYSSTRTVLDRIGGLVVPGTVFIFDEFYHYFGWEEHEAKAFLEFVVAERLEIEYLARTPTCQVSLRVLSRGVAPRASVRQCTWSPTGAGVGIRDPHEPVDDPGGPQPAAAAER